MTRPFCDHCRNQGAWVFHRMQWVDGECPKCGRFPVPPALPERKPVRVVRAGEHEAEQLRAAKDEMTGLLRELEGAPAGPETNEAITKVRRALAAIRRRRVLIDPTIDHEETAA